MEYIAKAISSYYREHRILPEETIIYMEYSIHSILNELSKICLLSLIFGIFGYINEFCFCLSILLPIRWVSGGVHASSYWGCFFSSLISIGVILFSPRIIPEAFLLPLYLIVLVLVVPSVIHSPKTPGFRPIAQKSIRLHLRFLTLIIFVLWISLLFFIKSIPLKTIGLCTLIFQELNLLFPGKEA